MRYLVLSDIHGNWEALEAVLEDAEGRYERVMCCGDLVGYGADPNRVSAWARKSCNWVVRGNHDRACTGLEDLGWFNPVARSAALWTLAALTPENAVYIRELPRGPLSIAGFQLLHGAPLDEDEYMSSPEEAEEAFRYLEAPLAFFGHTHVQGGFQLQETRLVTIPRVGPRASRHTVEVNGDCGYLANPGSVGQPRDGDPRAAYLTYDSDAGMVTWHRVAYDVDRAQTKILNAGLPPMLAERLAKGR